MGIEPNLTNIRAFLEVGDVKNFEDGDPVSEYHRNHPRYLFLKSISGILLDIGCGDGGLGKYITWPEKLPSVTLYGCDLDIKDVVPSGYASYAAGGYQAVETLKFVDGIIAIQLIEHLPNLSEFFAFLGGAKSGAKVYLEWPSIESCNFPSTCQIHQSFELGNLIMTSNYLDDETHLPPQPPMPKAVEEELTHYGFEIQSSERFHRDCDKHYKSRMIQSRDSGGLTMAYWENFGFAYVITAVKT